MPTNLFTSVTAFRIVTWLIASVIALGITSKSSIKDLPFTTSKRDLVAPMPVPNIALLAIIVFAISSVWKSDTLALTLGLYTIGKY